MTFDFMKYRMLAYLISVGMTIAGIVSLLGTNFNYGVDFKAGTSLDIVSPQAIHKADAELIIQEAG